MFTCSNLHLVTVFILYYSSSCFLSPQCMKIIVISECLNSILPIRKTLQNRKILSILQIETWGTDKLNELPTISQEVPAETEMDLMQSLHWDNTSEHRSKIIEDVGCNPSEYSNLLKYEWDSVVRFSNTKFWCY